MCGNTVILYMYVRIGNMNNTVAKRGKSDSKKQLQT